MAVTIIGVEGIPEVRPGDSVGRLVADRAELRDGDIVVIAQKVVSKAEGRLRDLREVSPTGDARRLAESLHGDPRLIQVVLDETARVVRAERVLIVETKQGFVCANAGVDHSNVPGESMVSLLPVDADASAAAIREALREATGAECAVIVSDTFGRPWRTGISNVALGVAGMPAAVDHRGRPDDFGVELTATVVAVADEVAAAAELVMGKTARIPAVVVRGYAPGGPHGTGRDLLRPPGEDLFR